ncbi:hypothetical protein SUGI_0120970 [Cryptomeria japonica]|nr:hypothetical protein SUGI_0120970 [Cryptomeria japonica]
MFLGIRLLTSEMDTPIRSISPRCQMAFLGLIIEQRLKVAEDRYRFNTDISSSGGPVIWHASLANIKAISLMEHCSRAAEGCLFFKRITYIEPAPGMEWMNEFMRKVVKEHQLEEPGEGPNDAEEI